MLHSPRSQQAPVSIIRRGGGTNGKHIPNCFPAPRGGHRWGPLTLLKPGRHVAQDVRRVQNLRDIVPEGVQILPLLGRHCPGSAPREVSLRLDSAPFKAGDEPERGRADEEISIGNGKPKLQVAERRQGSCRHGRRPGLPARFLFPLRLPAFPTCGPSGPSGAGGDSWEWLF